MTFGYGFTQLDINLTKGLVFINTKSDSVDLGKALRLQPILFIN